MKKQEYKNLLIKYIQLVADNTGKDFINEETLEVIDVKASDCYGFSKDEIKKLEEVSGEVSLNKLVKGVNNSTWIELRMESGGNVFYRRLGEVENSEVVIYNDKFITAGDGESLGMTIGINSIRHTYTDAKPIQIHDSIIFFDHHNKSYKLGEVKSFIKSSMGEYIVLPEGDTEWEYRYACVKREDIVKIIKHESNL